jgi:pilus assembly protein FimV
MITKHFQKRAVAVAVASCLSFAPWAADAAGLGKITVLSGLGQPLRAEVEVNATSAEMATMTARLAPANAFREAGVDYGSGLHDLRFSVEKRGRGSVVKVTSSRPVNEPFLDFLVELNWSAGSVVREYTFLLDPPDMPIKPAGRPASSTDARVVDTVRGVGAAPAETPRAEAPKTAVAPRAAAEPRKEATGTQVVQRGDTLRKIAAETKPEGVSLEQMLVGLFRKNPDAFVGENINRLKTGAILAIPDKATVEAIPAAEARKVYVAQAADWNAYRQKLATAAAAGPAKEAAATQEAGGKITARVEDKAAPAEPAKDQVKVSRTEVPSKGVPGGKAPGASEEELIAKDKALKEAQERLALLEKNVGELQKLVDMKTQRLAELQQQAAGKKEEPKPVEAAKPAEPPRAAEAPKAVEPPKPAEAAPAVAAKPAEPAPEPPKVVEAAKPAEPAPEPPKAAEAAKPVEEPRPAEVAKAPEVKPATAGEPGLLASLLENPLSLVGGGGILALLAAYFLYRRREEGEAAALSTAAVPAPSSLGPNSVFRMTGGQSVDTGTASLQTGEFSQTGPGTIDTDEVDPVAEADVYMAYGRDAQAEEILIEALRKDPQRVAIHGKLLEIYANRKSVKQFDTLASELYAQTGGVGSEWEKVAVLGADLDPDNPLYSAAGGRTAPRQEPAPGTATVVLPAGALGAMAAATAGEALLPAGIEAEAGAGLQALAPEIRATAEVAPDVDEAADLALQPVESVDFDLGEAAGESVTAVESGTQFSPEGTLIMGIDAQTEDFSEPFAGIEDAATKVEEKRADAEAGLLDFELDIGGLGGETAASQLALAEDSAGEAGTETIINSIPAAEIAVEDFDVNEISFEGAVIEEPAVPAAGFDMTSINLDLAAEDLDMSLEPAEGDGQPVDEVSTKLALARAYEEMGDHDQARELLEEVIAEGAGHLADQARQLLGRLRG